MLKALSVIMKKGAKYIVGAFPLFALASILLGNPYFSIMTLVVAGFVSIPVCFFAIKALTQGVDKVWAITSLACSSTFALLTVVALIGLGGELGA